MLNKKPSDVDMMFNGYANFTPTDELPTSTDKPVGYYYYEDPYETRSNSSLPLMIAALFFIMVLPISHKLSASTYDKAKSTFHMRLAASKLEEKIRMMRKEREQLQSRLDELTKLNSA